MKTLKSVEFSDVQLHCLRIEAKKRNLTIEQLVEEYTRKHLDKASGNSRSFKSNNIVTFETLKSLQTNNK